MRVNLFQTDSLGLKQLWRRHRDLQKVQYQIRLIDLNSYGLIVLLRTLRRIREFNIILRVARKFRRTITTQALNRIRGLLNL